MTSREHSGGARQELPGQADIAVQSRGFIHQGGDCRSVRTSPELDDADLLELRRRIALPAA